MSFFRRKKKRVICVYTVYALLLYLINTEDKYIDETYYILDETFPSGFKKRLKRCKIYKEPPYLTNKWWFDWLIYKIWIFIRLPHVYRSTELFMQDHRPWSTILSGKHKYTFIEDCPQICSKIYNNDTDYGKWYKDILNWDRLKYCKRLYGPAYFECYAHSEYANRLLLTVDDSSEFLKDRERIFSLPLTKETWEGLSEFKRKRICEIFGIERHEIDDLKTSEYILVTNPLYPDYIDIDRHKSVYERILKNYDIEKVLVKAHPRDHFDYQKTFPGIKVFNRPVPMEILKMLGLNPKVAITVYSSAVNQFGSDVKIHWYGTEIDDNLFAKTGHYPMPANCDIEQKYI